MTHNDLRWGDDSEYRTLRAVEERDRLTAKRDRAFGLPSPPPAAGAAGYEPGSVAPAERTKLALCVLAVGGMVLVGLVVAGLRWSHGIGW